jgi:hypothetical protein
MDNHERRQQLHKSRVLAEISASNQNMIEAAISGTNLLDPDLRLFRLMENAVSVGVLGTEMYNDFAESVKVEVRREIAESEQEEYASQVVQNAAD